MIIRPGTEADHGAVMDSWLKNYRSAYTSGLIAPSRWDDVMRVEIQAILDRAQLLVAHTEARLSTLGWVCFEAPRLLHYIYVFKPYRERRVATKLLAATELIPTMNFSCRTRDFDNYLRPRWPCSKFDPTYARHGDTPGKKKYGQSRSKARTADVSKR